MNNEPVAWMFQGAFDISTYVSFEKPNPDIYPNPTPLYTHPIKELTSLEIADAMELVFGEQIEEQFGNDLEEFARAILRKAQKK
jgi:hypothetical protein